MIDLPSLNRRKGIIKGLMTKLEKFSKELSAVTTEEEVKLKSTRVSELHHEFVEVEDKIFCISPDEKSEMDIIEEQYYNIIIKFNSWLRKKSLNQTLDDSADGNNTTFHAASGDFKLPRLNIPTFAGDYREWASFYDLFNAAVHENPSLTPAQKFQYLKGALKGEASALVRHFVVTEVNYYEAYKKLSKRYDRKNLTANQFIKLFMEQPSINSANASNIRKLLDTADEATRGLRALGADADSKDVWLIYILFNKLDEETKQLWMRETAATAFPPLTKFYEFLGVRADSLEGIKGTNKGYVKVANGTKAVHVASPITCPVCQTSSHQLFECSKFKALDVDARRDLIKNDNRCFNCLNNNHTVYHCRSKTRCRLCFRKHHSLLHVEQSREDIREANSLATSNQITIPCENRVNETTSKLTSNDPLPETTQSAYHQTNSKASPSHCTLSLLPTIVIKVQDISGQLHLCRALLDSESQCSFVTEDCAQRLRLPRHHAKINVAGLGQTNAGVCRGYLNLTASSRFCESTSMYLKCYIISKLTSMLPSFTFDTTTWSHLENLPMADPNFHTPGVIDILIGSDYFFHIIGTKKICGELGAPIAQETSFGWIIAGPVDNQYQSLSITNLHAEISIDHILRRFWEIEEISSQSTMTDDNTRCEAHYQRNTKISDGRFVVRLPFKTENPTFGKSMSGAMKRLENMEKRFKRDAQFSQAYHQFMDEYETLRHMERIPVDEINRNLDHSFYLPHHGVLKLSSTTTKLRVVFDASFKSSNGISLNDTLLVGPTLYQPLISILLRFRMFEVVFSADIEKMYRQILIEPSETDYQRILWRRNPNDPVTHYRLKTVTYGTSSAPYLATKTIQTIGNELLKTDPAAAHVILNNFYVDDLMCGARNIEEARRLQDTVSKTLKAYGLRLRKWSSNSLELLKHIDEDDKEKAPVDINDDSSYLKLLGIQWHPVKDEFRFNVSCHDEIKPTKRNILYFSAKIFDPLGWLAPITINFKIIFQKLWLLNLDWDDEIPSTTSANWLKLKQDMSYLQHLSIPRWLFTTDSRLELHGFADASENAYAAVVYCKTNDSQGNINIMLMAAKTKVAPINQVSIPRLELCAALLLTKLLQYIKDTLGGDIEITAWTDSTIVLSWLASHPRRWKTFVANRTANILSFLPRNHWKHVQTTQNPADCATRGLMPQELINFDLWWHGPDWLRLDSSHWPDQPLQVIDVLEEKSPTKALIMTSEFTADILSILQQRSSSFWKTTKVLGWVRRFQHNLIQPTKKLTAKTLHVEEIISSQKLLFKLLQSKEFKNELNDIQASKMVSSKSKLYQLTPFIDHDGIMRVGGCIQCSSATYDTRHPIILPKCYFTMLLVTELHNKNLHAGTTLLINTIRQKYHILQCRYLVKEAIRKCMIYTRYRNHPNNQLMGNLPAARVNYERPFLKVGVDYAGPLMIKQKHGRGQRHSKAYLSIFVCMCTKAVHIEVVSELSTDAFMACLRRFMSRRGLCLEIFSDNGSNFIGARNTLAELFEFLRHKSDEISSILATDTIKWHFIPSAAPSFGGLWEAAVKSCKFHLRRVMGTTIYTFEELTTIATQIEAILNSRPICMSSTDDIDVLTSGHFLIGRPITQLPEPDLKQMSSSRLVRWQHLQKELQHFWQRWQMEYLTSLHRRTKWQSKGENIKVNDLVIIKDDNLPPAKWLLARVEQVHPGTDGIVRVVTLKTKTTFLKRPVYKLCKLPIDD